MRWGVLRVGCKAILSGKKVEGEEMEGKEPSKKDRGGIYAQKEGLIKGKTIERRIQEKHRM